jgi:protein TonB
VITLRVFIMIRLSILRGGLVFTLMIAACGEKTNQPQPAVPVAAPAASQISPPAAKPAETPAQIMSKANAAFAANRLWSPAGDNALELFIRLKESGENVETAQEALVEIFPIAVRAAKAELLVDRLDEADRILTLLDRATPNSLAVADLRAKMNARRLALQANAEAAAVQTPVAPQVSEVKPTVAPEEPKVTPPAQSPVAEPSNTQAPQVDEPAATATVPPPDVQAKNQH